MKTLVTGGFGFIGSHLVARLLERGDDVRVLDSLEDQVHRGSTARTEDVELFVGDVGDVALADTALEGVDTIVHLAAVVGVGQSMYEIDRYVRKNTMATATFLERVVAMEQRPKRVVVASSMSIYGEGQYRCTEHGYVAPPPRPAQQLSARDWDVKCPECATPLEPVGTAETKPLQPTSVYAVTKRDHEELCLAVGTAYGIPTVALRLFNVYGPGQALSNPYTGVAAIFASRLLNGNPPVVFEDGRQSRDFIHVSDIVEGIVLALETKDAVGSAVNLGTGRPSTVNDVARVLAEGLRVGIEPDRVGQARAGDIRHCYADPTLARRLLGFSARMSLEDGFQDLLAWLEHQEAEDKIDSAREQLMARGLTL
jgi:dTDP-L-rhamnose 4-epimerase